ncbi:hypothetical protein HG530_006565 [Fusarium avenaceum]|nr:hypothetical protein HG530_006565 [Fusarium avenaceum]
MAPTLSDFGSIINTNTNTITNSSELEPAVSTNSIPTSSVIPEHEGRSIIFQVSIPDNPDNEKRSIKKRVSGGFVGNDNPGTCTFADVFNLADGQLFEGGVPIYYSSGEDYKEPSGQDIPSEGAIKSTFMVSERNLVFKNPRLPNGEAGFCQGTNGRVYITFTKGLPGCTVVNLAVYDVVQCQNGRLVGEEDSSTTSYAATFETMDSKMSTIETTSTLLDESLLLSKSEAIDSFTSIVQFETAEPVTESSLKTSASLMAIVITTTVPTVSDSSMVKSSTVSIPAEEMDTATRPSSSDESFSTDLNTEIVESTSLSFVISTGISTSQIPLSYDSSSDPADTATESIDITTELAKTTTRPLQTPASMESGTETVDTNAKLVDTTTESVETTIGSVDTTIISADTALEPAETSTESVSIPTSIESGKELVDIATETVDPTIESVETATESVEISVSSESSIEPAETRVDPVDTTTEVAETTPALAEMTTESVDSPTEDACVAGITNSAGSPPLEERKDDCSANHVVTVSPYTVTVTETLKRRFVWVVLTTWPPTPTKKRVARDEGQATTIFPREYPDTYATYCENADEYYDACSSLGVVQSTTTLPTPTTTEENPICRAKDIIKRAGEAMGYEFENHWELMTMPGYTVIAI